VASDPHLGISHGTYALNSLLPSLTPSKPTDSGTRGAIGLVSSRAMGSRALGWVGRLAVGVGASVGASVGARTQNSPSVTAKLVLAKSKVTSGRTLRGNLVLTNHTKQPVNLNTGCTPRWDVVLGRGKQAPGVAFSLVCGTASFPVAPGSHKSPFTATTTGLHAGKYRAFLVSSDPTFPTARPVPLTIVASS
jgi:hypothetical protein